MKNCLYITLLFIFSAGLQAQEVNTGTLLNELVDREVIADFPKPYYTTKQFSSYDRDSKSPKENGWFANWDFNHFVREEDNDGNKEFVLFDAKGPGAVVRFWCTIDEYRHDGTLRIYIDGNPVPVIEGEIISVLGKNALTDYPLASSVAEAAQDKYKSFNLYLPIAYSLSCKITYSAGDFHPKKKFFYNIGYREYAAGTKVKSFKKSDLKTCAAQLANSIKKLSDNVKDIPSENKINKAVSETLKSNTRIISKIEGSAAIRKIELQISSVNYEQALRSTVLKIRFDGKETVWVPVGDFFGTGYRLSPYRTWYSEVSPDSVLSCYWIMPFKEKCEVTVENSGPEDVFVSRFNITSSPWKWTEQSMYFGAGWFEKYNLPTRRNGSPFDVNYVTLSGQGVLVGTGVTLFDAVKPWWGEGDEKIYIDNEIFPSTFGTGTEDYFGYGWGGPEFFEHPFIAQPRGEGNITPGMSTNIRYRVLDAIPFRKKLQLDIEMWHWVDTKINYAPISFYYMKNGGASNLSAQPDAVLNPVALKPSDLFGNYIDRNGSVEFELMDNRVSDGYITFQSLEILSYGQQAWWQEAETGSKVEFTFNSDYEGLYDTTIRLIKSFDYSKIRISFNDKVCLNELDTYNDRIISEHLNLGKQNLKKGKNTITIEITGKNPLSKGDKHMCGLDCLTFDINNIVDIRF